LSKNELNKNFKTDTPLFLFQLGRICRMDKDALSKIRVRSQVPMHRDWQQYKFFNVRAPHNEEDTGDNIFLDIME